MKYAIIADIHAHLAALQAVLRDAEQRACTHKACLGDIVGYYNKPKECVDIVREMGIPCVQGNHDAYCASDEPLEGFNPKAAESVLWTRAQLTEEDRRWLRNLPLIELVSGFTIVHATLDGPQRWGYVFDKLAAAGSLIYQNTSVCFFGHTHVPVAFVKEKDKLVRGGTYSRFKVEDGKQYFVNPGSVGQPRDQRPDGARRAAYAIYDLDAGTIELRLVDCEPPEPPPGGPGDAPVPGPPRGPRPRLSAAEELEL
jgi:predicted phosphodiesterase